MPADYSHHSGSYVRFHPHTWAAHIVHFGLWVYLSLTTLCTTITSYLTTKAMENEKQTTKAQKKHPSIELPMLVEA